MATQQDYSVAQAALAKVIDAAIKANVPDWAQADIPEGLKIQLEQQGAKAVVDAVDAARNEAKGLA